MIKKNIMKNGKEKLPENWDIATIDDISTVILGQSPSSSSYNFDRKGLPFFQGKAEFGAFYPKVKKWCTAPKKIAKKNDILISVRAPVGPTNLSPSECCIGRGLAAIRPYEGILYKYLLYFLRSIESNIESQGTGTTFKAISGAILKSVPISLAPTYEQKRIVTEIEKQFSRLDEAINTFKRMKINLKQYKASVLKAAVEGKLTEEWRKANPDIEPVDILLERISLERRKKWEKAELTKMKARGKMPKGDKWKKKYKEPSKPDLENLPGIPDSWLWVKLESVTEIKGGITKDSKRKVESPKELPYLRVANVQRGYLDLGKIKHIAVPSKRVPDVLLEKGDILFNEGGDRDKLGRGWIWEGQIDQCTYQNHVFRARLYLDGMNGKWFSWFGNTFGQQYFMAKGKQTTNLASINKTMLSAFPVPLPPIDEQSQLIKKIDKDFSVIDKIDEEIDNNLKRSEHLRQSILKKAFSGKLVKAIPGEETAKTLLERIQRQRTKEKAQKPSTKKGKRIMTLKNTYIALDEVDDDHLSKILTKDNVVIDPKSLWQKSELTIDDFYAQLKLEVEGKLIEETPEKLLKLIA
ncbi:MAG: hypothetical protein HOJ48_18130 [Desulfobacula sp.]|jgi:type I restriction enzyme, S subunit|nr:hypothetical protein [Desulfobacula sp.]MBT7259805.1 hypothetical protein [Desulfobacula sp.]